MQLTAGGHDARSHSCAPSCLPQPWVIEQPIETFGKHYRGDAPLLSGLTVHDPFMGGGTTLIEASRLGATVSGTDVDPTAQLITLHGLQPAHTPETLEAAEALMVFLREHFSSLYPDADGEPLHAFSVAIVTCPQCSASGPLYRSLVLARDCAKPGAVVRDDPVTVFDPETFELRYLRSSTQERFQGSRAQMGSSSQDVQCPKVPVPWVRNPIVPPPTPNRSCTPPAHRNRTDANQRQTETPPSPIPRPRRTRFGVPTP